MKFEDRINRSFSILNDTDRHIIKKILRNMPNWEETTLQDLADLTNSSTASIHRMLNKLKYSGFSEFKFFMVNDKKKLYNTNKVADYKQLILQSVENTLKNVNDDTLVEIFQHVENASRIYGFGTGTEQSEALATFAKHMLYYDQPIIMLHSISDINVASLRMKENDVLFVTSLSGNTEDVDELITILRLRGIIIISITSQGSNSIASSSNYNLYFDDDSYYGIHSLHWPALSLKVLLDYILHRYIEYTS